MQIHDLFPGLRASDMLTIGPALGFLMLQQLPTPPGANWPAWIISVAGAAMAIVKIYLWLTKDLKEEPTLPIMRDILIAQKELAKSQEEMAKTLAVVANTIDKVSNEYVDRIGERIAADSKD